MNNFLIKKIYIKNFKSIDEANIEFDGSNLNVLDGPNGFGKTTIYDAIQLILTGKIRRIESNKIVTTNRGYDDHLLSKDQTQLTVIKIEFADKEVPESRVVLARILRPNILTSTQRRPHDFTHFELYRLNDIEDNNFQEILTNQELNDLFGVADLEERYNLYHYIEQEESCYLFKQNEKERMGVISKIFNIEQEMGQKQYLEKTKNKLIRIKTKLDDQINKLENEVMQDSESSIEVQSYHPLIDEENVINVPWDQENIKPLDSKLKDEYINELNEIKSLILNFQDFKNELKNETITAIIQNKNKLKALIINSSFIDQYEELENTHQKQSKLKQILDILRDKEILQERVDWDFVFEVFEPPFEKDIILQRINSIKTFNENANGISTIVNQMNITREKLLKDYHKLIDFNPNEKNDCPLCGDPKESLENLIEQINQKTNDLKQNFDESAQLVNTEIEKLYNDILYSITTSIEEELRDSNIVDSAFIEQLKSFKGFITDWNQAREWFNEMDINLDLFINKEMRLVEDLDQRLEALILEIEKKKTSVSDICKEHFNSFKKLYRDRFNKDDKLISKISLSNIMGKIRYVESQYYLQSSLLYQKLQQLKEKYQKTDDTVQSLARIITIYNEKINKYRGKMISDIEIPFYIYSGKIIQNHQRGIGVFIKEERDSSQSGETQLKAINFVPPQKTDHDIVHSFSSGQLSSTVIAFTLALNKVYGNKGFMTVLIDDPIQTMDEMNMASFVELLRNEFTDRQLVLSTHEDNISLYIRYKFLKYGLSVGNINVKQKLYV